MPVTLPPTTPCGRSEALGWINKLCNAEYPTVESLRDGAAYCSVIEAAASRLAKNCAAAGIPEFNDFSKKAAFAKVCLSKVDWSATEHMYEFPDPSHDNPTIKNVCLRNMEVLQKMMRCCLSPEMSLEIHSERLAAGKLQEHMQYLQWLCNFIRKVLTHYTKTELSKKAERTPLEGRVKMNRAMLLLDELRHKPLRGERERSSSQVGRNTVPGPSSRASGRGSVGASNPVKSYHRTFGRTASCPAPAIRSSTMSEDCGHTSQSGRSPSGSAGRVEMAHDDGRGGSIRGVEAEDKKTNPNLAQQRNMRRTGSGSRAMGSLDPGGTQGKEGDAPTSTVVAIPDSLIDTVLELRSSVENLEQIIATEHRQYQNCLSSPWREPDEDPGSAVMGERIVSLREIEWLQKKRDRLAQVYMEVESIVRRRVERGVSTPLLMHVCSILYPPSQEVQEGMAH